MITSSHPCYINLKHGPFRSAILSMESVIPICWGSFEKLSRAIKSKGPEELTRLHLFHRNNASSHKFFLSILTVHEYGFRLVDHRPYSLHWTPSTNHLSANERKNIWSGTNIIVMMKYLLLLQFDFEVSFEQAGVNFSGKKQDSFW